MYTVHYDEPFVTRSKTFIALYLGPATEIQVFEGIANFVCDPNAVFHLYCDVPDFFSPRRPNWFERVAYAISTRGCSKRGLQPNFCPKP